MCCLVKIYVILACRHLACTKLIPCYFNGLWGKRQPVAPMLPALKLASAITRSVYFAVRFYDARDSFHTDISRAKCCFSTRNATRCKPSQMLLGVLYCQCEKAILGTILTKE